MPFTQKKRLFDEKYEPIGGGGAPIAPLWICHWCEHRSGGSASGHWKYTKN